MLKILPLLALSVLWSSPGFAKIKFINGPAKADIGDQAEIAVPDGWRFVGKDGMKEFDEDTKNLYDDGELGVLLSPDNMKGGFWAYFTFNPLGYIKDAASEKLDADSMWAKLLQNNKDGNEERQKLGYPTMDMLSWVVVPKYNPADQRLEWAYDFKSKYGAVVNYNTRILGRNGVMELVVVPMGKLDDSIPVLNHALDGFSFKSGGKYSEYVTGDKLATAGLAALVVGGLGAAAASSGLLGKLWKLIVVGFVAAMSAIRRFWNRVFGKKSENKGPKRDDPEPPAN